MIEEICAICEQPLSNREVAYSTSGSAPLCYRCFYFFGNIPLPFFCCIDCGGKEGDPQPAIDLCRQLLKLKLLRDTDDDDYAKHRPAYYAYLQMLPEYLNQL